MTLHPWFLLRLAAQRHLSMSWPPAEDMLCTSCAYLLHPFTPCPCSPGSCFFLPHGTRIYNALQEFVREKYWSFEYEEVSRTEIASADDTLQMPVDTPAAHA